MFLITVEFTGKNFYYIYINNYIYTTVFGVIITMGNA